MVPRFEREIGEVKYKENSELTSLELKKINDGACIGSSSMAAWERSQLEMMPWLERQGRLKWKWEIDCSAREGNGGETRNQRLFGLKEALVYTM